MIHSCSIIIPTINYNKDLEKCLKLCNELKNVKVNIYVISDIKIKKKFRNTFFLSYGKINMSEKRNLAVNLTKDKYIAFLDSDSYPSRTWLINGIKKLNKNIGLVTGPDFPYPNQKGFHKTIGLAHKSFILSGSKTFRKNISQAKEIKQASSCNMIMKKKTFDRVNGMDSKIFIGEDVDFCNRINKHYKILYSPNVKIFHKSRKFLPFLAQRYAYGTCVLDTLKKSNYLSNIQYFGPLIITLGFILTIFSINTFIGIYLLSLNITFYLIILFESIKLSLNIFEIIKLNIIFVLGIIFFGIGSISKILGISKNLKAIYTYRS